MSVSFFHSLMTPKSIAIVGASNNPMKMGTMHALSILKDGFQGKLYPVHPSEKIVLGQKAYASPGDLPEAPDLAMFVLPAQHLLPIFEAFGQIGTKYAIVITAGFKELGPEGIQEEQRLKNIAKRYGMRFVGPNCMGIINQEISLNTTVMPLRGKSGSLGMISQSGTYVAQTILYLQKRGIYFSKAVSVGNEADVNIIDVLEYFGDDEHTKAISVYIETIRDIRRFLAVASKITPRKPVIAQYVGGTEAGGRAGLSHTGSMAGNNSLYDGLFKQAGVIRAHSIEDLYGWGFALATQPRIRGNRIGIITNSGGPGSAIADACDANGCRIPVLSKSLQEKIKPLMPSHAPCANPVDLTFAMNMAVMTDTITNLVMQSGEVDGIVLHGAMSSGFMSAVFPHVAEMLPGLTLEDMLKQAARDLTKEVRLPFTHNIPMTVSAFFDRDDYYTEAYEDNGVPVYDSPEKAARAMCTLVRYKKILDRKPDTCISIPAPEPNAVQIINDALSRHQKTLDEYAAKKLLACYGFPVPEEQIVNSSVDAVASAKKIGFPVAVKACDPEILHKTEQGLVHLNLNNTDDVAKAFSDIQRRAGFPVPVLVSRMVSGKREFLAGITHDGQFGHCVAFGVGGIFTEAVNDIVYRLAPISRRDAEEMISDIKTSKLLGPCRGMPAVDFQAMADVLVRLSFIPLIHPEIREIDMNPLIISGERPVAVDALIILG
ncbi:MAG: acetate--CoA ligase family protein [Desulfobacterales bacterium]|nr:acetate--CoA ligase family protein [Desulfobacterales bacterium]